MQVGCYALDLYCDNREDGCPRYDVEDEMWDPNPDPFVGPTASACRRQAREAGWKLKGAHRDEDICPVCVERGG